MSLLFDENISRQLPRLVAAEFPDCQHVAPLRLLGASDDEIWRYAAAHSLCIVNKVDDFRQRVLLEGTPPKVLWLSLGNASTNLIAAILNARAEAIRLFLKDQQTGLLIQTRLRDS
jgi:predicted nuclease of predicted toxin-antitoxin system